MTEQGNGGSWKPGWLPVPLILSFRTQVRNLPDVLPYWLALSEIESTGTAPLDGPVPYSLREELSRSYLGVDRMLYGWGCKG